MEKIDRLNELENEIRKYTLDLLGPIAAKVVVNDVYSKYFEILDEIKDILEKEQYIPKSLMKIIIYIYLTVESEAEYMEPGTPLFNIYVKLNGRMLYLLGDEPLR